MFRIRNSQDIRKVKLLDSISWLLTLIHWVINHNYDLCGNQKHQK